MNFFVEKLLIATKSQHHDSKNKNYGQKIVYFAKNNYLRII
jgi:hypothetical protein